MLVLFLRASSGWIHLMVEATGPLRARSLAMLLRSDDNPPLAAERHNGLIVWQRPECWQQRCLAASRPAKELTRDPRHNEQPS